MFQPVGGRRVHSDHQHIEPSVGVEICQGVRHAEGMRLRDPFARDVREVAPAVVRVYVDARKIAHDEQIEVAVGVQVAQRGAVGAPPAFLLQPRSHRGIGEISMAVV